MRQQPKLLYAVVARGTVTLAEHSNVAGNANLIAVRILEKLGPEDTRVSYSQERHMFHVLVQDGLTCMVMAEESSGRRIPFAFLDDIRARFYASYGNAREALAYEYSTDFGPVLAERMAFFGNDPAADTITRVKGELLEVKNIMIENIEKVLERGEKLDLLVDKTDNLQETAFTFRREARRMRRTMWWRNVKLWFAIGAFLLLLLYTVLAMTCGPTLSHC
ncbi:R-SNARE protein, VAMP71-family [Haematococcus lacustris]